MEKRPVYFPLGLKFIGRKAHLIDKPFQYYAALEIKKKEFEFLKYTDMPAERQKQNQSRLKENARG